MSPGVRKPAVAGMFYSAQPEQLKQEIQDMLDSVSPARTSDPVIAAVVPHAGYMYSGKTAAAAYVLLRDCDADTVVIVSPSHREHFQGMSIYSGDGYETPLGIVEIDSELRQKLITEDLSIHSGLAGHRQEHAIEVQLPFIQTVLPGRKILPIVMGDQSKHFCLHLSERLAECLEGTKTIMLASSDLSHFYSYDVAERLDAIVINDINQFDPLKLMDDLEHEKTEACGGGPIVAVLSAAKKMGGSIARVVSHCNSGDVTGDRDGVVGYLAAIVEKAAVI